MKITYASKHGKEKIESQDCILVNNQVINNSAGILDAPLERLCIADGVGGVPGGYEASAFVLNHFLEKKEFKSGEELKSYLYQINDALIEYAASIPEKKSMATTFTGLARIEDRIFLMHAGNTRMYACTNGLIQQITEDHTNYQALVSGGVISEGDNYLDRNVIYCCFGTGRRDYLNALQVEEIKLGYRPEYLLFTSDGIHDYIAPDRMESLLNSNLDDRNKILALLDEASNNGSGDDCTIVVARLK